MGIEITCCDNFILFKYAERLLDLSNIKLYFRWIDTVMYFDIRTTAVAVSTNHRHCISSVRIKGAATKLFRVLSLFCPAARLAPLVQLYAEFTC